MNWRIRAIEYPCVAIIAIVTAWNCGWTEPRDVLEAQAFELVGSDGLEMASLSLIDGGPTMRFLDKSGQTTAMLRADEKGAAIDLQVGMGAQAMTMRLDGEKGTLRFGGSLGGAISMSASATGASLEVVDKKQVTRLSLSTNAEAAPALVLFDPDGKKRLNIALTPTGEPVIQLIWPDGEIAHEMK